MFAGPGQAAGRHVPGAGRRRPHDQHLVAAALRCRPRAWIAGAAVLGLLNFDGFPFIIEYLGDVAHGQPHQRARDHGRNRELEGLGYTVLEVTVRDLDHPDVLRARILGLRAGLLAAGARQTHVATTAQDAGGSDGR